MSTFGNNVVLVEKFGCRDILSDNFVLALIRISKANTHPAGIQIQLHHFNFAFLRNLEARSKVRVVVVLVVNTNSSNNSGRDICVPCCDVYIIAQGSVRSTGFTQKKSPGDRPRLQCLYH